MTLAHALLPALPLFTEHDACRRGFACEFCRRKVAGRAFRESLRRFSRLPGDEVDFDCPHGNEWLPEPEPRKPPSPSSCTRPLEVPADVVESRLAICNACDRARDDVCLETRRRHPNKPALIDVGVRIAGAHCPLGKWNRHSRVQDRNVPPTNVAR